jgi:tetratricopeptide (TPR) repeat protein
MASSQLQRSLFTAAIATCKSVLQQDQLCAEALLLSGVAWGLSGRDAEAVVDLQQALFLRPELWPAAFYLASSLERIGQVQAACAAYQWVGRESHRPRFDEQPVLQLLGITAWRTELVLAAKARGQQLESSAAAS